MTWNPGPLKHWLVRNDSGVWGDDPTGIADTEVLRSTDISLRGGWSILEPAVRSISARQLARKRLETGDLVVVTSSGSPQHLGKTAIVTAEVAGRGATFANFVQRLTPRADADPRYIGYLLNSKIAGDEMAMLGNTTTGLRNLNGGILGSITCPGPSFEVQRSIADYLDTETASIDALIAKKRRMIQLLDEQRKSVTVSAVTGVAGELCYESRPSRLEWADAIAAPFDEVLLRLVARQGTGHTPSREHPEWWISEECVVPWITTGEVQQIRNDAVEYVVDTRECISLIGIRNSSAEVHPKDTVFLSRTASAGFSGIMGTDMATSQDYATWTCGPLISPRYLLLCLRAMRSDLLGRLAMGSTHKTIYMPDIQSIRVPLPALADQERIVNWAWGRLKQILGVRSAIERQIDLLAERRQALVTAAVTGELPIPGGA